MSARIAPFRARLASAAFSIILTAFLAGCESPFTADDGGKPDTGKPDTTDPGKNTLNRYEFLQGKFLATDHAMDLAIEGKGMFILKDDTQFVFLRRPAMFSQDADGYLHLYNARHRLQGIRLYSDSNPYPRVVADSLPRARLSDLGAVRWLANEVAPPKATTVVKLIRNLDSESLGKGSILYTQPFLHHAQPMDLLIGLRGSDGNSLGIQLGDILTFSATGTNGTTVTATLTVDGKSTLATVANELTGFLRRGGTDAGLATTVDLVTDTDSETKRGALSFYGNTAPIRDLKVTSNRSESDSLVARAFAMPAEMRAGITRLQMTTETLRAPAMASDRLDLIYDAQGNRLGLETGDTITFSGALGRQQAEAAPLRFAAGAGGTSLDSLFNRIRQAFGLAGMVGNLPSVSMNAAGSDDSIRDGSIVIRGTPAIPIQDVSIHSTDANRTNPSPNFFNTNMNITIRQRATEHAVAACSLDVYDDYGKARRLSFRFVPSVNRTWYWEAGLEGVTTPASVATGTLGFDSTGALSKFSARHLMFQQGDGAALLLLRYELDATGLTQSRSASTVGLAQDGYPSGTLEKVSIDADGIITGSYANGRSRPLFHLPLADFANPAGLRPLGEDSFVESPVSGKPVVLDTAGTIRSGSVEYLTDAERTKVCTLFPGC